MTRKQSIAWLMVVALLVSLAGGAFAAEGEATQDEPSKGLLSQLLATSTIQSEAESIDELLALTEATPEDNTIEYQAPEGDSPTDILAQEQEEVDAIGLQEGSVITVGATTGITGNFGLGLWGSNATDEDIRTLIHGYSTVAWTEGMGMGMNSAVVSSVQEEEQENGDWRYTIEIVEGLTYNDGTPVTARDYVFSLLLLTSPQIRELGVAPANLDHIAGLEAYQAGETPILSGVSLISEQAFAITITAESLPYYYGIGLLNVTPYPIDEIAPGCDVFDKGEGAYIATATTMVSATTEAFAPGMFSAQMLQYTLLDEQEGYENNPRVTTGAYQIESIDLASQTVNLVVNTNYVGNYEGQKPHIERIVVKKVESATMVDDLTNGDVQLLTRVSDKDAVEQAKEGAMQTGSFASTVYPRSGLAFLSFSCEEGATASESVRKAISLGLDLNTIVPQVMGNVAEPAYGYYGIGQWMSEYETYGDEYVEPLSVPDELELLRSTYELGQAKALLEKDGWTLNSEGASYQDGVDRVRYRKENGELVPLRIKWAVTQESTVARALQTPLREAMGALGIDLQMTVMPFSEVLEHYYRLTDREYQMFFLASNFDYLFDPYYDFNTADEYQGIVNKTGLRDQKLQDLAEAMRQTNIGDRDAYARRWLAFQQRFVELQPMVPLYSSNYYDFYDNNLRDYHIDRRAGWSLAILYVWIDDTPTVG